MDWAILLGEEPSIDWSAEGTQSSELAGGGTSGASPSLLLRFLPPLRFNWCDRPTLAEWTK